MIICEYLNYEAELPNREPELVKKKKFLHECRKKFHGACDGARIVHQLTRVGLSTEVKTRSGSISPVISRMP
jgi:hypothetical protein